MAGSEWPWGELIAAFVAFLASHVLPSRPRIRAALCAIAGERAYVAGYSLISLVLLGWLIVAAGRAPFVAVWEFAPWQLWVPNIAMPVACALFAFGVGASNPFSFGGRAPQAFDPEHPGIAGVTRHPLLLAIVLWAGSHAVPNGDLAHVLLFGTFALAGVAGMLAIDRRTRRRLGEEQWQRLAARTSLIPGAALLTGRWRPDPRRLSLWRLALAFALYVSLVLLHQPVIGVSPQPGL
ncbi:MAG TPA: NnrU family protein [Hyphomicrobiaceae bacterium]|nr:NnrU family protein [Hyphomicrobiaceae bacterium]